MSRAADRRFTLLVLACLGALVSGCSDIYYDRRNTLSLDAGDAVATNIATHTIDVWPAVAGERQIVSNGEKIQTAVERYRTNKVIAPVGTGTSSIGYQSAQPSAASGSAVTQ